MREPRTRAFRIRQAGGLLPQTLQSQGRWGSDPRQETERSPANAMLRPRFASIFNQVMVFVVVVVVLFSLLERAPGSESSVGAVGRGQAVQETPSGGGTSFFFHCGRKKKEESATGPRRVSCQVNGRVGSHPQPGGRSSRSASARRSPRNGLSPPFKCLV